MEQEKLLIVKPSPKDIIRFISKISIDNKTGCWNWNASTDFGGYGHITYNGRLESAHRIFYAWLVKPIPRKKGRYIPQIDHLCRNRLCCNPKHMELVSFKKNILRGNSPSAIHARQTHCKNGHRLPEKPNYFRKNGKGTQRICLICRYNHEHSPERIAAQKIARYKREHGPKKRELLKIHREREALRRKRIKLENQTH